MDGRSDIGFVDGYHIDVVLRDSFLSDFVNEKKETIYQVNSNNYNPIVIEISDDVETAEGQRIDNLVKFITRIAELNGVDIRRTSVALPSNCISINGK